MQPPAALIKKGITSLPCVGDGRQSGTSGSPSILNASPEAAAGGGLAGASDRRSRVASTLNKHTANILISEGELKERYAALDKAGATNILPARRPGRRSSAPWWTSSLTAWCSSRR